MVFIKKIMLTLTFGSTLGAFCMTEPNNMVKTEQDFENCILNVHGILRDIPQAYCSLVESLKLRNGKIGIPITNQEQLTKIGVILVGPTGVGKTELAQFLTEVTEAHLITPKASEIISSYIGQTAANISKEFKNARDLAQETQKPVILFFDEIDKIAGYTEIAHRAEYRAGYQQFDQEMDQCKRDNDNIIIIGATNYIESCAKEFRNRFLEINIDTPQGADERDVILSWYLLNPHLMRTFELKDIEIFHQTIKDKLPLELHNPFDQLIRALEKLTNMIIDCENGWQPTEFDFYHLLDHTVVEIQILLDELAKHSKNFDDLIAQYGSLNEIRSTLKNAVEIQNKRITEHLRLNNFLYKNVDILYELTEKTDDWNFRELEELAAKIRKYNGTLTKKAVLKLREGIKKEESKKNDSSIIGKIGSVTLGVAAIILEAAVRGSAQEYVGSWNNGNNDKK